MNALDLYFQRTGDNPSKLAERIGRSPSTITRPLSGERNVSMDVALEIERATKGEVSAEQFMAICFAARKNRSASALTAVTAA
jgi:DNA-binding transcriptional regulator YdaS (Cro superfamily)